MMNQSEIFSMWGGDGTRDGSEGHMNPEADWTPTENSFIYCVSE